MRYNHGAPDERSYDSCYYKLVGSKDADPKMKYMNIEIVKAKDVNAFVYGGENKNNLIEPIYNDNEALEDGDKSVHDASMTAYPIAYPNQDVDTDFEFTVWLGGDPPPPKGSPVAVIIIVIVAVLLVAICIGCFIKYKRNKESN
jgi:hypothetical protein